MQKISKPHFLHHHDVDFIFYIIDDVKNTHDMMQKINVSTKGKCWDDVENAGDDVKPAKDDVE